MKASYIVLILLAVVGIVVVWLGIKRKSGTVPFPVQSTTPKLSAAGQAALAKKLTAGSTIFNHNANVIATKEAKKQAEYVSQVKAYEKYQENKKSSWLSTIGDQISNIGKTALAIGEAVGKKVLVKVAEKAIDKATSAGVSYITGGVL